MIMLYANLQISSSLEEGESGLWWRKVPPRGNLGQWHQLLQEIAISCTYSVRLLKPTCAWVKARANKRMWVNSIPLASSNSCNFWRIESKKSYCESALNGQYFSERKTIANVKKLKRKTWRSWDDAIRCLSPSGIWAYKKKYKVHTGFTFKQ